MASAREMRMAARHFAATVGDDWEDESSVPVMPRRRGKHFKVVDAPPMDELELDEPPIVGTVDVESDVDARARAYIDQIMRELESATAKAPAHAKAPKPSDVAVQEAKAQSSPVPEAPSDLDATLKLERIVPERIQATTDVVGRGATTQTAEAHATGSDEPSELDATLVLDRVASALRSSEILASNEPVKRLEVSTDYVQNLQDIPEPSYIGLAHKERKQHFGFFARIGAFVSRVLRLDER